MPLLWLLLPFAALAIYARQGMRTAGTLPYATELPGVDDYSGGGADSPAAWVPDAFVEVGAAPERAALPELPLAGLGELILNATRKIFVMPAAGAPYADSIGFAERRYGLPESLLARVLYEESRFRPDIISGKVTSDAGAIGIAQFMPATARDFGINPLDARASIDAAARYLSQLYGKFGDWAQALGAYNWGQGRVERQGLAAAPLETRNYIARILGDVDV